MLWFTVLEIRRPQPPRPSTRLYLPSCQRNHVPKGQPHPPIIIPNKNSLTLSLFISTNFRLKRLKNYSLPFTRHRPSLTAHPTTTLTISSTPSTTSTMKTSPNTKISTTTAQSTSTAPTHNTHNTLTTPITHMHDTLTTITNTTIPTISINTTTPITAINTTTPIAAINTTTNATQTQISSLMELNISLPPRISTPLMSLTIPLSSSS